MSRGDACPGRGDVTVERGLLMRVFPVPQVLNFVEDEGQRVGEALRFHLVGGAQVAGDHGVVARGVGECLRRQPRTGRERRAALGGDLRQQRRILGRIDAHGDKGMVLRGRAQHRGPANINVFNRVRVAAARARDRFGERIEVHDQQVDWLDLLLLHHGIVDSAPSEQAAVNLRMQGLHPAVHDLGEPGDAGDLAHGNAMAGQQPGRATGGKDLDLAAGKLPGELEQAGLVGDGKERAADGQQHAGHRLSSPLSRRGRIASASCAACRG